MSIGPFSGFNSATDTSVTTIGSAPGANLKYRITTLIISNSSSTDTEVLIKSNTTTLIVIPAPNKGGATITLPKPLFFNTNEACGFASGTSVTTMTVSMIGDIVPYTFTDEFSVVIT